MTAIRIIPRRKAHTAEQLPDPESDGRVLAADFHVEGSQSWRETPWGLEHPAGRLVNVDHHAPIASMRRYVSSANLALEYVRAHGPAKPDRDLVAINHLDCDSVLSAGILSGRLEPRERYGDAAIAADHTGEEHPIAELLQGLDAHWSRTRRAVTPESLEDFFGDLKRLEREGPLSDAAQEALAARKASRKRARTLVEAARFQRRDDIWFAELEEPIEGELFLPLLPDARMVVTMNPHREDESRWQTKIRLRESDDGLSLHDLDIPGWLDPAFGGRWNAGSNNRGGGTDVEPERYLEELVGLLRAATRKSPGSRSG